MKQRVMQVRRYISVCVCERIEILYYCNNINKDNNTNKANALQQ